MLVKSTKTVTEEKEVAVSFPYYYECNFAPDPHSHPSYVRIDADGTKTTVSEPDCCKTSGHELEIEQVNLADTMGYVLGQSDYYTTAETAKDFHRILSFIQSRLAGTSPTKD